MHFIAKLSLLFLAIGMIMPLNSQATWKPEKTIMVYVGFGAGGGIDTAVRVITNEISKNTGWNFTVINKPGGGGSTALKSLKRMDADGYSIALTPSEAVTFNSTVNPRVGFTVEDFSYISAITKTQGAMVSLVDTPWETFADVVQAAKDGEEISIAYLAPKMGLSMKAIQKVLDVEFVLVPVKGGAAGMKNVLGKHVDISWGAGIQDKYVKAGQMKVLASVENERLSMAPDVPTMKELGVEYVSLGAMFTFIGPKNMPDNVISTLSREIKKATESDKIKQLLSERMAMKQIFLTGKELRQAMDESLHNAQKLVNFVKK